MYPGFAMSIDNPQVVHHIPYGDCGEFGTLRCTAPRGIGSRFGVILKQPCGTLLDLHNLYVGWRNGGPKPSHYIEELDADAVVEIHLSGGDDFAGFYMDSHSSLTPPEVWGYAFDYAPRFKRLRAITFEFQETYYERLGVDALVGELNHMHELAVCCNIEPSAIHAR
jgi:uncharacterized protein (UPF0276 family)